MATRKSTVPDAGDAIGPGTVGDGLGNCNRSLILIINKKVSSIGDCDRQICFGGDVVVDAIDFEVMGMGGGGKAEEHCQRKDFVKVVHYFRKKKKTIYFIKKNNFLLY